MFLAWHKFLGEARTRILLWYAILMAFFIIVAIPAIRQRLFVKVEVRVRQELIEEIGEFNELLAKGLKDEDLEVLEELQRNRISLSIKTPLSNQEKLAAIFDVFFTRALPEDDTFLIAILNKEFYKSTPRGLPKEIDRNSKFMQQWQNLSQSSLSQPEILSTDGGSIIYVAEPIEVDGKILGVFVVAHTTEGERNEALEAFWAVIEVKIFVLVLALLLAWFAAGKILSPLRLLAKTAHSISESDLTQRIKVEGEGELAELANSFNQMMDRLEAAFASQRNFVNDAGHELRTPITIIQGHLELMGDDPQEQKETLALVMDELDRMNRLVNDLLLLARSERLDFLQLETVDIKVLTEDLFAKAKALDIRNWHLDSVAKGKVVADRQRITEAMMNLAQNATQHTTEDDTIAIGSAIGKTSVRFWVRDTGDGIEAADQQRIFERFARVTNSRRRSDGSGLGLSIVKAIAEAHGGKINLRSQLGTGSTFTIVIPLEPAKVITEIPRSYLL
jgi:signal transduction histidine kinase